MIAENDKKACSKCKAMGGEIIEWDDAETYYPPYHFNCRCELAFKLVENKDFVEIEDEKEKYIEQKYDEELYENNSFYRQTADMIAQIQHVDSNFEELLNRITTVYQKNKNRYEKIAIKSVYFPPEVIAAIHYRENAADFLAGTFGVYLHNGQMLGKVSTIIPYPDLFQKNEFDEAAIDALKGKDGKIYYKEQRAKKLNLKYDSRDLIAMVAYTQIYNGWPGEMKRASYAFNGADFVKGHFVRDGVYDENSGDKNVGTYFVLKKLLENNN